MATIVGGGPTARFWHPWLGLIYIAGSIWMLKMWLPDMTITDADRAWQKSVKYYVENQDDKLPAIGRFNWGQKIFFWVMFWGGILLLLSGLGLWFVESIPAWLRHLWFVVQLFAALGTMGALIITFYMATAMVGAGSTCIVGAKVST